MASSLGSVSLTGKRNLYLSGNLLNIMDGFKIALLQPVLKLHSGTSRIFSAVPPSYLFFLASPSNWRFESLRAIVRAKQQYLDVNQQIISLTQPKLSSKSELWQVFC